MSSAVVSDFSAVSALFNIEVSAINGKAPSPTELVRAVQSDVSKCLPVSKTAFFKYFCGNKALSREQLHEVISALKEGMKGSLEKDPEAYLSYAHASVICQNELTGKKS